MRLLRSDLKVFAPLLLSAMLGGCTAQEPTTGDHPSGDPSTNPHPNVTTDFKPPAPVDMAKPDDGKANAPVLDAIPNLTEYDSVPVHGTADVGASVLIKASDGSTVSADVLPSGRFCADVPLKKESMNSFELKAIDQNGNESDPVMLNVQQHGAPMQQPGGLTQAQNMAIGGATASSLSWNAGNKDLIHDGNLSSFAGSWQRGSSTTDYVTVQMSSRRSIDHIRIRTPAACPLTVKFDVYVSDADAPSDPGTTPMAWQLLKSVPTGAAQADYTINLAQATPLTHVSLFFDRGFIAWGADDINCGDWWNGAYYEFSDIEVWSAQNAIAPPPTAAPSCTSGTP